MNQQQAWNIFTHTGSIDAYLLYLELKNRDQRREDMTAAEEPYSFESYEN